MPTETIATLWTALRPTLLDDNDKNRLSPEKIAALTFEQKINSIAYLMDKRWPVVAELIPESHYDYAREKGYSPGYKNQYNDYWLRSEHVGMFQKSEPPVPVEPTVVKPTRALPNSKRERKISDKRATPVQIESIGLIAEQMKELRLKKKLTHDALAKMVNTQRNQISRLESGHYSPNMTSLDAIFKAMGKQIVGLKLIDYVEPKEDGKD